MLTIYSAHLDAKTPPASLESALKPRHKLAKGLPEKKTTNASFEEREHLDLTLSESPQRSPTNHKCTYPSRSTQNHPPDLRLAYPSLTLTHLARF
jgi:hypothetical protein